MLNQATAAADDNRAEQAKAFAQQQHEREAEHASKVKELESQLLRSEGERLRTEAAASKLIDSMQREHVKEIEAAHKQAHEADAQARAASAAAASSAAAAASSSHRLCELEKLNEDSSMTAIAKKVLTGEALERALAVPSLDEVGRRGWSVGTQRLSQIGGVVGAVLSTLLGATPFGQNNPAAVLLAAVQRRGAASTLAGKGLLLLMNGANAAGEDGLAVLGSAYLANMRCGDKAMARAILSMLVSMQSVKHDTIQRVCSFIPTLKLRDQVYVTRGPNLRTAGMVMALGPSGVTVVSPNLSEGPELLPLKHVVRQDAILCTQHQIKAATHHARERFPGAAVLAIEIVRAGNLSPERAEAVANFLRDPTVGCWVSVGLTGGKGVRENRVRLGVTKVVVDGVFSLDPYIIVPYCVS